MKVFATSRKAIDHLKPQPSAGCAASMIINQAAARCVEEELKSCL